ncbi:MAG: hypothetical protein LBV53_01545 [Mycoplasmataceae bacterium]|nr:hypothetical protein [Mycoplasmataceae bacterium]
MSEKKKENWLKRFWKWLKYLFVRKWFKVTELEKIQEFFKQWFPEIHLKHLKADINDIDYDKDGYLSINEILEYYKINEIIKNKGGTK